MKDIIKIRNLNFSYDKQVVLEDINLEYNSDEFLAIIGPNGGGKSTLLKLILGLLKPQSGEIKLFGKEPSEVSKFIGYVPQNFLSNQSFPMMVLEVVLMGLIDKKIFGFYSKDEKKMALEALEKVGMSEFANARIGELSGGQKQRVAIARALALNPKILLSDEATSALDPNTTNQILELLEKINKELDISVVIVTHEMEVVKSIAKRAILLEGGKIIGSGSIEELFLKPDEKMKEFLGEVEILPSTGTNIRLFFPKEVAQNSVITHMARSLNIDFNIVWGKLEKLNDNVLGSLVINIDEKDKENVLNYIKQSGVLWEVA